MSAQSEKTFRQAKQDTAYWGKLVESAVGAHLLNGTQGTQIEVFYWREDNMEVDFVLRHGKTLVAIEVKSGSEGLDQKGADQFVQAYKPSKVLLVGQRGIPVEEFLQMPVKSLF